MKDWIPLKVQIPDNVTPVLVYWECCDVCYQVEIAEIENNEWFVSDTGENLNFQPTHWMALPLPPTA